MKLMLLLQSRIYQGAPINNRVLIAKTVRQIASKTSNWIHKHCFRIISTSCKSPTAGLTTSTSRLGKEQVPKTLVFIPSLMRLAGRRKCGENNIL
jgi:hypothetical protein